MGVGITRHISRSSVCIRAQDIPSLGAKVQVIVDMPPARANTRPGRLLGEGVAVRLERAFGQTTAFAAKVRFRSKWACPELPRSDATPWREDAAICPVSHHELPAQSLVSNGEPFFVTQMSTNMMDIL